MYETVTLYKTTDGTLHDTPEQAEKHVLNRVCDALDVVTAPLVKTGRLSRAEQFRVVETIAPDLDTVRRLVRGLSAILGD